MENRRLIFFLFFLYFFIGYQGTILRYIRAYTRIGFMQRKFNRRTVYACLRDVVVPAAGILKREAFLSDRFMNGNGFITRARWKLFDPPTSSPWFGISKAHVKMSGTKRVLFRSCRDEIRLRYICSACEGYEEEKDDRWNIPKIYLHKNMNIILPIIFQLLLAFSSLFHSVSIYSKKQSASR